MRNTLTLHDKLYIIYIIPPCSTALIWKLNWVTESLSPWLLDINECLQTTPVVCAQLCIDKPVGYECSCVPGYTIHVNDSKLCQDVNECLDYPCPHYCTNNVGSYKCSCADGYIAENNGHMCRANSSKYMEAKVVLILYIKNVWMYNIKVVMKTNWTEYIITD